MVRGHYFADQSPPASRRCRASSRLRLPAPRRARLLTAQNIGWGTGPHATPAGIVSAWMQSPPHRAIILTGAYRDAGVGVRSRAGRPRGHRLGLARRHLRRRVRHARALARGAARRRQLRPAA